MTFVPWIVKYVQGMGLWNSVLLFIIVNIKLTVYWNMKTTTAQFVVTVKRVNKLLKSALISDVNDKRG